MAHLIITFKYYNAVAGRVGIYDCMSGGEYASILHKYRILLRCGAIFNNINEYQNIERGRSC